MHKTYTFFIDNRETLEYSKVVVALFYIAVMTSAFPDYSASQEDLILLQNIASYMLLACGVVYVIMVRWKKSH